MLCTSRRIATSGSIVELLSTCPLVKIRSQSCRRPIRGFSTQNVPFQDKKEVQLLTTLRETLPNADVAHSPCERDLPGSSPSVATRLKEDVTTKHGDSDVDQLAKMQGGVEGKTSERGESSRSPRKTSQHSSRLARGSREIAERIRQPEVWQTQKQALQEKFGEDRWAPRKRLSPDTLEGIRSMHASDPERYSTPVLAEHFKVSPEAIRRILKSKWQPKPEEMEDRRRRWESRGERIWTTLAEIGTRPPKKWREMGVGKAELGDVPKWKKSPIPRPMSTKPPKDVVDIAVQPMMATRRKQSGPGSFSERML
jgi:hypothetical protein